MYSSMPRTRVNYRLDDRVLAALNDLAGRGKTNQFIEGLLIDFLQKTGRLPNDFEPLTEGRGGARPGAGKPKSLPPTDDPADTENHLINDGAGSTVRSPNDVDAIGGEGESDR